MHPCAIIFVWIRSDANVPKRSEQILSQVFPQSGACWRRRSSVFQAAGNAPLEKENRVNGTTF